MTRLFTFITLISGSFILFSCKSHSCCEINDGTVGNWIVRAEFQGVPRAEGISLVIGDSVYLGTGTDGKHFLRDFWQYNVEGNYWVQRADFPGDGRSAAVSFAVGSKGYLGTGNNGQNNLKDFWQFDPTLNQWTRKADFIGSARMNAIGFAINDTGYIATGNDGADLNDFYKYNPAADAWTLKPAIPGVKRSGAVAFVYKNQAYVCTGISAGSYIAANDMWLYDPASGAWSARNAISNVSPDAYDDNYSIIRGNAAAFVLNDYGYITCGENGAILKDTWEYSFAADQWFRRTDWEGVERTGASGFSAKNRGFVGWGRNTKYYFDDLRAFIPSEAYNAND